MMIMYKVLILLLAAVFAKSKTAEHIDFKKEWKFPGKVLFKYGRTIATKNNSFTYAACTEDKLPAELNCNVTIETPKSPWKNNKTRKQVCSLNLTGSTDGDGEVKHEVTGLVSVDRFADDRVLALWWERQQNSQYEIQYIKVSILRMSDCTATHLTFPTDFKDHVLLSNLVSYADTFDVFVSHKETCGTSACRISHDADGRRLARPSRFISNFAVVQTHAVAPNSSDKGFFVSGADMNSWKYRAMHVSAEGFRTNLMTVSVSDPRQVYAVTSYAYELFGACLMGDRRIYCAQFDREGSIKMNASLHNSGYAHWMAVRNFPDGGVLLATGNCNNHKCRNFRVAKIRPGGIVEKTVDVPGLRMKCNQDARDFSADIAESESEFCFYFACARTQEEKGNDVHSSVKFRIKCVAKREF